MIKQESKSKGPTFWQLLGALVISSVAVGAVYNSTSGKPESTYLALSPSSQSSIVQSTSVNKASCIQGQEKSRMCLSCRMAMVTYNNADCSNYIEEVQDETCTSGCPAPTVTVRPSIEPTYPCNCKKTCANLSCAEAQYQLNVCGCSARDGDNDGIACDTKCQ